MQFSTRGPAPDAQALAERLREVMSTQRIGATVHDDWSPPEGDAGTAGTQIPRGAGPQHGDGSLYDEEILHDEESENHQYDEPTQDSGRGRGSELMYRLGNFGRAHFAVIAVICVVVMVAATGQLLRARSTELPSVSATVPVAATSAAPSAPGSPSGNPLRVHVTGAVVQPGVQQLPADARVTDALKAAGGLRDDADPGELNMAAPVCDGCQLVIGTKDAPRGELKSPDAGTQAPAAASAAGARGADDAQGTAININAASSSALEELPGVGPVTAGKIIDWRTQHGKFSTVEQLQEVDGIGPKLYERIKPHVTV